MEWNNFFCSKHHINFFDLLMLLNSFKHLYFFFKDLGEFSIFTYTKRVSYLIDVIASVM